MRFAYADPPYPGQAKRHYGDHPDFAGEVDHPELIRRLSEDYDYWALSTSSTALQGVLAVCPSGVRVAAWVKPFAAFKNQRVTFAWEPVIYVARGGSERSGSFLRDWVSAAPPVFRRGGEGTMGEKPQEFCFWLFSLLGMRNEDELHDLFPGSGAVTEAWTSYRAQTRIAA